MHWSWARFFLTLLVGLLCALAYHLFFRRKGKRYEEVYDRVVEDTNDESTQLRMLADRQEATLKAHDEERRLLTGQHATALAGLAASNDTALATERSENVRLQGVVAKLENATEEARALQVQITNQKDEYARLELDWRRRLDEAEAKVAATAKQIADADAVRAKAVTAAEASVADASKRATDAEAKVVAADAKTAAAEARAKAAGSNAADAATKLAAAESSAAAARSATSTAEARIAELQSEVEAVSAAHTATAVSGQSGLAGGAQGLIGAAAGAAAVAGIDVAAGSEHDGASVAGKVAEDPQPTANSAATVGDDLVIIEGIGPKTDELLRAAGITTFAQIRDADQAHLRSILEAGGIDGAASLPTWSRQASLLIAGDVVAFKAYTDHLIAGVEPDADDLTVIEGIGPKLSEALVAAGITTYRDVATAGEERLMEILVAAGQMSASTSTWGEQARFLAAGDRAGFDAYAERLVAGRDTNA
jgi:predicted flap endonuclease-1-like 5' DNA nuclease